MVEDSQLASIFENIKKWREDSRRETCDKVCELLAKVTDQFAKEVHIGP